MIQRKNDISDWCCKNTLFCFVMLKSRNREMLSGNIRYPPTDQTFAFLCELEGGGRRTGMSVRAEVIALLQSAVSKREPWRRDKRWRSISHERAVSRPQSAKFSIICINKGTFLVVVAVVGRATGFYYHPTKLCVNIVEQLGGQFGSSP